ncbi:bifunctional 4-hydroxy-2-oxoglutarate aldolase/2-dehydro-3-deoxy-phosphogluconate aldolase [Alicyclobacillus dauci]|uniref:Bifunctional 4-hydroxy-2-oxoglutarate aldolase/2-dehydro-3-deoxy-phosphogluconate aldolase n=1 Tax=Alicyclobacillus dauci TaxID=1475485 RepID=A0ABY6Z0Z7_9BACL|nr:bifunctional 4-hydroxy-2-oxoglutarate aldolase/2-dehydro-3-deoxy-phosphogluconate aldolase [Alicyclobacillus dauci]WAH36036.1 bifunctional 4-hydroxy-2-oxoglutarate aldolase/2-dehydro-3-deoxy-phosphogluconate aldolase [Alicyclobacillus dauci]
MNITDLGNFLRDVKIVAVVRKVPEEVVGDVVSALVQGGISALEITLDSAGAIKTIASLRERFGDKVAIGAGTVLTTAQLNEAVKAGAEFLVGPHFDAQLVERARTLETFMIPGVLTPTEIQNARAVGAEVVKVFPAGTMGPSYIKDLLGPFGDLKMMVTGGISEKMRRTFLRLVRWPSGWEVLFSRGQTFKITTGTRLPSVSKAY